jgi:tetratricopeptide (TPR) repeat protein
VSRTEAEALEEYASHRDKPVQVIAMGGSGKSQMVAAFVRESVESQIDLVVWASARSRRAILDAFEQAALALGYQRHGEPEKAAAWFVSWLQRESQHSWVVVLDDAAEPADLRGLIPGGPSGITVLTSRRLDITSPGRANTIKLGVFSHEQALRYVCNKLDSDDESPRMVGSADLVAALGLLPLALAQATAFMASRQTSLLGTCAGYLELFNDRSRDLSDAFPEHAVADDYEKTTATTWSISIEAADDLNPHGVAGPLLQVMSLLDPSGFPVEFLDATALGAYLLGDRGVSRSINAREAFDNLSLLSLASCAEVSQLVTIHALIQRASRESLPDGAISPVARVAADSLMEIWPEVESDTARGEILRSNATAVIENAGDVIWSEGGHLIIWRVGESLGLAGQYAAALAYWSSVASFAERALGSVHRNVLTARANVGRWLGKTGDYRAAVRAYEELFAQSAAEYGEADEQTLSYRHNIAYWRALAGDHVGALREFEELLEVQRRVLGADDRETLVTRGNIIRWRMETDPSAARDEAASLANDMARILGGDHPDTLKTRSSHALACGMAGDMAKAVALLETLLDDICRVHGTESPGAFTTRANIAKWRAESGDLPRAKEELELLIADRTRILGADHPETMSSRHSLANLRGEIEGPSTAVDQLTMLLDECIQVLGSQHPRTERIRRSLNKWQNLRSK